MLQVTQGPPGTLWITFKHPITDEHPFSTTTPTVHFLHAVRLKQSKHLAIWLKQDTQIAPVPLFFNA